MPEAYLTALPTHLSTFSHRWTLQFQTHTMNSSNLRLQRGDQQINLVETLETPERTLAEIMYTPGLAVAVLRAHGIEPTEILTVTPDLEGTDVRIEFYTDGQTDNLSQTVQCQEFLVPFRLRRAIKRDSYKVAPLIPQHADQIPAIAAWLPLAPGATLTAVFQNEHKPAHLVVCEPQPDGQKRCRCTCPDAQSQWAALPTHPALWDAIGRQPICKHWLRHEKG